MRQIFRLTLKTLLFLFWCGYSAFSQITPGELLEETIKIDEKDRKYLIYIPSIYKGDEKRPLIFSLHGARSNAKNQLLISGLNQVADTANFIVVYPEAVTGVWNEFQNPELADDVQFIDKLINHLSKEYKVDLSKVYICGYSNGAGMTYTLGCSLSSQVAAIAAISSPGPSTITPNTCDQKRVVPMMYMHGTADLIVPFKGGRSMVPDLKIDFPSARESIKLRTKTFGCEGSPEINELSDVNNEDNSTVTTERYMDCDANVEVVFYIINNGGHTWAGSPSESIPPGLEKMFGNINRDIKASHEIWKFFSRHQVTE